MRPNFDRSLRRSARNVDCHLEMARFVCRHWPASGAPAWPRVSFVAPYLRAANGAPVLSKPFTAAEPFPFE
ncbi:PHP domain-containing protein [Anopheles sinensis]|uniref:PHP domain-containing protein n=1 Tax=Anopheles sinensis TaxID=74873 RepID=A0A084VVW7_ANOSI|nr:PHP domain-containing protein [Anopheles sinensis]